MLINCAIGGSRANSTIFEKRLKNENFYKWRKFLYLLADSICTLEGKKGLHIPSQLAGCLFLKFSFHTLLKYLLYVENCLTSDAFSIMLKILFYYAWQFCFIMETLTSSAFSFFEEGFPYYLDILFGFFVKSKYCLINWVEASFSISAPIDIVNFSSSLRTIQIHDHNLTKIMNKEVLQLSFRKKIDY